MNIKTSCPECGHEFEIVDKPEQFEKMAAQMVSGTVAPKQTCGYDVVDRFGIKYQVKYSIINRNSKRWCWNFRFRINGEWPDYFILYGVDGSETFCFLLSTRRFFTMSHRSKDFSTWLLSSSNSLSSNIWDYRVTPETFESKLNWLISIRQFTVFLDDQNPGIAVERMP